MKIDTTNIHTLALNERGAKTAIQLGLTTEIGPPGLFLDEHWNSANIIVLVMALPIVMRLLSKRNLKKGADPVVIAVDESGTFVIPVLGGHRGANRLAKELAARINSIPVVTTASEHSGIPAVDGISGFTTIGDAASLIELMLEGYHPAIQNELDWPMPINLENGQGPGTIIISDLLLELPTDKESPTVQLIPPSLVIGIGCSTSATEADVKDLIASTFSKFNLHPLAVAKIATIDKRKEHPAIVNQNINVESFAADQLNEVEVVNGSAEVETFVGTKSVSEAAALLASHHGKLIVHKHKNSKATIAIARQRPKGSISLVGLGPGSAMMRTPQAVEAIISAEVVIGYTPYVNQCKELLAPHQMLVRSPIGNEVDRATQAIQYALAGRKCTIVCSGDPEVFAMASITFETLAEYSKASNWNSFDEIIDVSVVPGITAALAGGASLGAPLGHDHAYLSLSDLLTPWETIEKRLEAFGEADIVITIYNPQSKTRNWQLPRAFEVLSKYRDPDTPVAVAKDVGRRNETTKIFTLDSIDFRVVNMTSLIIVGSSTTKRFGNYLYTPRGYNL